MGKLLDDAKEKLAHLGWKARFDFKNGIFSCVKEDAPDNVPSCVEGSFALGSRDSEILACMRDAYRKQYDETDVWKIAAETLSGSYFTKEDLLGVVMEAEDARGDLQYLADVFDGLSESRVRKNAASKRR